MGQIIFSNRDLKRPLLIYDGDCTFCRYWIVRWKMLTGTSVDYAPYQSVSNLFPQRSLNDFRSAVQLVQTDGTVCSGAEAVFKTLAQIPGKKFWLWMYEHIPGFGWLSERSYSVVAAYRSLFYWVTILLWGKSPAPSAYVVSSALFLRFLGFIYFTAFFSLETQMLGLIGSQGISSAASFLETLRHQLGLERYWLVPSFFWLNATDGMLRFACGLGSLFSILLMLDVAPALLLALNGGLYLSLVSVGGDFLRFQWDALLLETGFLALFLAPLRLKRGGKNSHPPSVLLWLFRWLLFRLMFASGMVKLLSGDPTWHNFTALQFHYFTQPLPPWTAWYIQQQLPAWFQELSCGVMFFVELVVPWFVFFPRRPRSLAAAALIAFQLLIAVTGNYCFFNLLAIALCLLLFDDKSYPAWIRNRFSDQAEKEGRASERWPRWVVISLAVFLFTVTIPSFTSRLRFGIPWPGFFAALDAMQAPFQIANNYGLFAIMTTARPEIVVEGSVDGKSWLPYEFKYKAGDLNQRPRFVAPHQPRLDWQMWFAALGGYKDNPWFISFCARLLQGSKPVLALLKTNPFPASPPVYIRARMFDYHFADVAQRRSTGAWWQRSGERMYCPVLSMRKEQ